MKRYLAMTAIAVGLIGTAAACRTGDGEAALSNAPDRPPVMLGAADVARVARADLIAGLPVSGTLEPAVKVQVNAPYPEVVDEVLAKEGEAVARGAVLARFRTDALEPAALSAEAQRRIAAADYERMQNLFHEGAVAERDVENAEVTLRAAEAAEARAKNQLADAQVRSPVTGTVTRREVDAGDRVKDGVLLFEVVNTRELELKATVPSEYVGQLRVGAPVAIGGVGLPVGGVEGRVARINAAADPATRQVRIYVTVPNADRRVVAGLYASGRVVLRRVPHAIAVPQVGVRTDPDGKSYVLIVADGRIARRDVTVGAVDEVAGLAEISHGLEPGALAVIGPAEGLTVGQAVNVTGREG